VAAFADDLVVDLFPTHGVPQHLAAANLRYELYRAPDFTTALLAGDADDDATALANATPGNYYLRVFIAAPTANPAHAAVRYHSAVRRP
jgi:hypothetical protein